MGYEDWEYEAWDPEMEDSTCGKIINTIIIGLGITINFIFIVGLIYVTIDYFFQGGAP